MKSRRGFVSNSSTASFMMRGGNIEEIAPHMLEIVIEAFSEDFEGAELTARKRLYNKWKANLKAALKRKDIRDGELGITMPSCNYDTYLIIHDDYLYITTCSNHIWGFNGLDYSGSSEYAAIRDIVKSKMYFNIRNKLIHDYEHYNENDETTKCPKCSGYFGSYVIDQKGRRVCGECFEGELEMTEAMKLEKLREKVQRKGVKNPISSLDLED